MFNRHNKRRWHILSILVSSATLALIGGFAIDAISASAKTFHAKQQQSRNWAGYIVQSSTGKSFSSVSGSWTQPRVGASSTGRGYSAFWVGLGGASGRSRSLEQVGSSADWVNGKAEYYAWYELLPTGEVKLSIAIHPGDHMSGKVRVTGTTATIWLSDRTTGQSVTKSLRMSHPDTSSAEWVAEAPSATSQAGVSQTLPLADFGKATFTGAFATAGGHTGSISDSHWTAEQVQLSPSATVGDPAAGGSFTPVGLAGVSQSSSGASTSSVSDDGSSFSVSYTSSTSSPQSSTGGYGSSGYGYGGPGPYGFQP